RRPNDVRVENAPPRVGAGVDHANERTDGGRVDEVVDTAQCRGRLIERRPTRCLVGDIAFDGDGARTGFLGRGFDAGATPGEQGDLSAALGKTDTNATPKATRRPNDHCP